MIDFPYYARALQSRMAHLKKNIILIFGARQTGKTTLLRHLTQGRRAWFVNLQDRRLRRRYETDEGLFARQLEAREDIDTVVVDEIQKVPALLDDIQYVYDRRPAALQFYVTGSSSRQLKRGSANLLPGRCVQVMLSPVLQAEQRPCELLALEISEQDRFPLRSLESHLIHGNLPGFYSEDADTWPETIATYTDLYVEDEIRQENLVGDMGAFNRFLRLAALESGQLVNYSKMADTVGVSVNTIRNYYQILEDTYIGIRILPYASPRRRVTAAPRFLLFDLGVRHSLAELRPTGELLKMRSGHIFEQWVMTELFYRCLYRGKGYGVSSWRTTTGVEVDLIVETPEETIPIEIKWTQAPQPRDAKGIEKFIALHPRVSHRGFVICRAPEPQRLSGRVTALPWNRF